MTLAKVRGEEVVDVGKIPLTTFVALASSSSSRSQLPHDTSE